MMILSILDKYNIKATFFICGNNVSERSDYILQEIVKRGHKIGIHSYTHDLDTIYQSVDAFLKDFNDTYNYIYETTGIKADIFRFPGGSINSYNTLIYREIIAEMSRRGFVYYDWNASGEDAAFGVTWTSIYNNVISSMDNKSRGIILLHDGADKYTTVTVVEDLILYFQSRNFEFDKITNEVKPVTFGYID
jgi:peptidoglycan/xylan/chitin deacetylase (PgdA/CDA1 family)